MVVDMLNGFTGIKPEGRSKYRVPTNDLIQRSLQCGAIQFA